jgi:cytolysin (calcineurin-like family phosphatase)
MKINLEVECSPEEARRFLGLPDITKANEVYVDTVASAMQGVGNLDQLNEVVRQIAPMGQLGLKLFQQILDSGGQTGANQGSSRESKPQPGKSE